MSPIPTSCILDFDGTITTKDTISTLFDLALAHQTSRGADFTTVLEDILSTYATDYSSHVEKYAPVKNERTTLAEEVAFYRSLKAVEHESFARVSGSGIFKGIGGEDWKAFGDMTVADGRVVLRRGVREFLERIGGKGRVGVVSVNFEREFVKGVLRGVIRGIDVLANGSDETGVILGTKGVRGEVISTSDEKLEVMRELLDGWGTGNRWGKEDKRGLVYIGDSGTDLECLTEEGVVGIVLSEDTKSSLMKTLARIGMRLTHVAGYEDGLSSVYWARDFQEILDSPIFK